MNTPVASPPIEALALLKINPSDTVRLQSGFNLNFYHSLLVLGLGASSSQLRPPG